MKTFQITILIALSVFFLIVLSSPLSAQSTRDIMVEVDNVLKDSYTSTFQKVKLSTCKYSVKQKRMACTEEPRVKVLESILKDYGTHKRDSRSVNIILEPVSDRGICMLTYEYYDADKDNDFWLYLPALGKVKRLISSSDDSEESGSFFGTEFSIEDVEDRKIDDYTYKILKEETYEDRPVWIIESIPTPKRLRKTRYSKIISWVDKERYVILKDDLYNHQGNHYKQMLKKDIVQIDNVWIARKAFMNNLSTRRITNMELISAAFNMEIPDEFLTQRTLTDFAFRERNLVKLRTYLK